MVHDIESICYEQKTSFNRGKRFFLVFETEFPGSHDDSGCVPVCFVSPPAARVPIEETVETKKVEMKEKTPTKGTPHPLNVCSSLLCHTRKCKFICVSAATKILELFRPVPPSFLFNMRFSPLTSLLINYICYGLLNCPLYSLSFLSSAVLCHFTACLL